MPQTAEWRGGLTCNGILSLWHVVEDQTSIGYRNSPTKSISNSLPRRTADVGFVAVSPRRDASRVIIHILTGSGELYFATFVIAS